MVSIRNSRNMYESVQNNKDTRMTLLIFSSVFIVNFEYIYTFF